MMTRSPLFSRESVKATDGLSAAPRQMTAARAGATARPIVRNIDSSVRLGNDRDDPTLAEDGWRRAEDGCRRSAKYPERAATGRSREQRKTPYPVGGGTRSTLRKC